MISIIKSFIIILACLIGGGILGFFGPFVVSQFLPENPAFPFLIYFTVPFGLVVGLILGLVFAFR